MFKMIVMSAVHTGNKQEIKILNRSLKNSAIEEIT